VVLGRAANNARRARSLHLEAVLDDAGCQPKATIAHLYVQPIRVTNVETSESFCGSNPAAASLARNTSAS
jgi:hypothetical protein